MSVSAVLLAHSTPPTGLEVSLRSVSLPQERERQRGQRSRPDGERLGWRRQEQQNE